MAAHTHSRRRFLQSTGAAALASLTAGFAHAKEPDAHASSVQLGVTSYSFRQLDLDTALALTRRLGLKHISLKSFHLPLDSSPEKIATIAAKVRGMGLDFYGVGVVTMHKSSEVTHAFDYARAAGVRVIIAAPTPAMLPLIDEKVKKYDLTVAIHNHGPEDKLFPTPDSVYRRVKHLDRRIGLCMDVGHTLRAGADPVACALHFGDRLFDMHLKDVDRKGAHAHDVPVGRGVLDVPGLIRALKKVRYRGVASFEYELDPKKPLPGLAESLGYTRGVLDTVA